ncbi:MAG: carboxypeptidase regulatory-like domain-containing protein [Acidobacteria bacterium]|nr:carboxypeptidase regulatory-like domain-containing protein [Acidobacteriota bacterium]
MVTALLSTFVAVNALAQVNTGTLRGRVSDTSGRPLAGAQILLRLGNRPEVRAAALSDRLGQFEFTKLAPESDYRLRVVRSGYVSIEAGGISMRKGETRLLQITLDPRHALTNAITDVKTVGVEQQVRTLPVRGQASGNLETLVPGAGATGGTFGSFPVNGSRAQFNTYVVSATNNLDPFRNAEAIGQGGAFAAPAVLLPLDAIQVIEVQTNTGAEYGPSGAAVLTMIKRGGPQVHGSLFEFFDNDKLAANNFYNNAFRRPRPEFRNNQFGFTVGGPLPYRNYLFTSYEGQHERVGVTAASRFPTQAEIAGAASLVQGAGRSMNGLASPILALYPASFGQGPLSFSVIGRSDGNTLALKADHSARDSDSISASYAVGANRQLFPQGHFGLGGGSRLPRYASQSHTVVQLFASEWQRALSPRSLNAARFGYSRYQETTFPGDKDFNVKTIGLNTGVNSPRDFGLPEIDIAPGEYENLGASLSLPRGRASNVFDLSDRIAWDRGAHQWKFGASLTLLQENAFTDTGMRGRLVFDGSQLGDQLSGDFALASLVDLLAGLPAPGVTTIGRGDSHRYLRQRRWAAFIEDGWRLRPALKVTVGLRHDQFSVPAEKQDRLSNFLPAVGLAQVGSGGLHHEYQANLNDFAPRAAFSLALGGVRTLSGGWGLYFDSHSFDELMDNSNNSNSILAGPVFNPIGSGAIFTITPPAPLPFGPDIQIFGPAIPQPPFDVFAVSTAFPDPRYQNFNLALEQQLGLQQSLRIAYYGTRGAHLPVVIDTNQPSPGNPDPVREQARRPFSSAFPQFRVINTLSDIASSNYNSLQVSTQRSAANVTFRASYTFSKSLDDASGAGGFYRGPPEDSRNLRRDYGRSDFDIRHRFTVSYAWRIPAPPHLSGWLHALASNWQLNGITTLESGGPINITLVTDNSGTGEFRDRPNLVGDAHVAFNPTGSYLNPAAFALPAAGTYGNLGRNTFSGPGLNNFDMSFVKSQHISGDWLLRLRAEFFNIWNHPNFANPSTTFGSGFKLTSTPDSFNPYFGNGSPRNVQLVAELEF